MALDERFASRMSERDVAKDTRTLADFVALYCRAKHKERPRSPIRTDAALLGVYGRRTLLLCEECEAHLEYGERRRAFCPKDPKPFCAHCEVHCYRPSEAEWQRQMMRFSGPRSVLHGHAIDGVRHVLEARRFRKTVERSEQDDGSARAEPEAAE